MNIHNGILLYFDSLMKQTANFVKKNSGFVDLGFVKMKKQKQKYHENENPHSNFFSPQCNLLSADLQF